MKNLKKLTTLGLLFVFLISSLGMAGCSSKKNEKIEGSAGLVYELSEDGTYYIMVDGKACTEESIVIGNWHEENGKGLPVKAIGAWPFSMYDEGGSVNVKNITVADGITEYGEGSLGALSYVEKIVLPDGVESLGTAAFLIDFELRELVIGKGLKRIEVDSFEKVPEDIVIYFRGSKEEWEAVEIAERGNAVLNNCKIVFDYKD